MLLNVNDDVKTSGRTTRRSGLAFALQSELLPARNSRGDLHRDLSFFRHASGAAARVTRSRNDLSRAATLRAGARDREEALLITDLSLPAALWTNGRRRSGRCAGAFARFAVLLTRNLN